MRRDHAGGCCGGGGLCCCSESVVVGVGGAWGLVVVWDDLVVLVFVFSFNKG